MAIPGPSVTTTNFKDKGFRCAVCGKRKPVVSRQAEGMVCDDCLPEDRRGLVTVAEDE